MDGRHHAVSEGGRERGLRRPDARHRERGGVGQHADDGEPHALARLRVPHHDRDGSEWAVFDVEALELEVGDGAEVVVLLARDDLRVDDGEIRVRAEGTPHGRSGAVSLCHGGELVGRVPEECRIGAVHEIGLLARLGADLMGLDGQDGLARDDAEVGSVDAAGAASALRMSRIGLVGAVVARMSNPPPNVSMLLKPLRKEPVVIAPVTSVKTTSVNMASVTPVRNRLASGYASESLSTGAMRRLRPSVLVSAAEQDVGVEHERPAGTHHDREARRG